MKMPTSFKSVSVLTLASWAFSYSHCVDRDPYQWSSAALLTLMLMVWAIMATIKVIGRRGDSSLVPRDARW